MNSLIYWGVVLAGASTLLIEANRNFSISLTSHPFSGHPILRKVEVGHLCTRREKNLGFAFYSLLYLVTYVVALSSTEVYELLSEANVSATEIGPTDTLVNAPGDPLDLAGAGYAKPIFISSAIIAVFSVGAMRTVESTMRALSHRLAGIPRGVYAVIEDLHSVAYRKLHGPTPLSTIFTRNAGTIFSATHSEDQFDTIQQSLLTIDHLAPAITGKLRVQHFPSIQLDSMRDLSETLEKQVSDLRSLLSKPFNGPAERKILFDAAMITANDTIALFAVHFIRNNRSIKLYDQTAPNNDPAIREIRDKITRDYQVELNSFGMSICVAALLAILFGWHVYWKWSVWADPITAASLQETVAVEMVRSGANEDAAGRCSEMPPREVPFDTKPEQTFEVAQVEPAQPSEVTIGCFKSWRQLAFTARNERFHQKLMESLRNLSILLAVGLAGVSALIGRDVRREDNSWPAWRLRRPPFLRILSMALMPAALAVLGIALGGLTILWIAAGFDITKSEATFFFESSLGYILMYAGLGGLVAIGVLVLIDQHDHHSIEFTVLLGFGFGLMAVAYSYLIVVVGYAPGFIPVQPDAAGPWFTFRIRETLVIGSFAFLFLFFFSVFLEMTEQPNDKPRSRVGMMTHWRLRKRASVVLMMALVLAANPVMAQDGAVPGNRDDGERLRVGVRALAKPFSYRSGAAAADGTVACDRGPSRTARSGPLRAAGYDGYMVHICDEVLKQMLIRDGSNPPLDACDIDVVNVDEIMQQESVQPDRLALLGDRIDILCDPATISPDRVRQFAVSPPVFVTSVGYLILRGSVPPGADSICLRKEKALIGVVGSGNAAVHGVQSILDSGEWKQYRTMVIQALRGSEDCPNAVIQRFVTHDDAAAAFCAREVDYYVGDLEIILEHARSVPGCDVTATSQSFTNDRYAIFAAIDYGNAWRALRIGRFFDVLNREIVASGSLLDRAYFAEFGTAMRSKRLDMFYWSLRGAE